MAAVTGISVDRYERVFQPEILGLPGYGWNRAIDTDLPDGRRFAIAVCLAGSRADAKAREAAHAAVARLAVESLRVSGPQPANPVPSFRVRPQA